MKFKFSIIAITALLTALFIMDTWQHGLDLWKLLGIVALAAFLFWVDHKLERPVSRSSIKHNMTGRTIRK
ncbi:hypothetical protein ERX37_09310 [Macrococcus hajekii]|uniref:Uncharacterized protein n=1 Tax=Macrococcus hajekii TaxID=198482 RepID=A0A4R6BI55_9STAP|nr:hypothetical protein [Macrococcus hajekii]TDM01302.1 hypothetical protein ERX37_09310 [Macrococcus hajekii]GGB10520.1 hypothetical protein GCM10007190_18180 [Macrococcus hajekii]